MAASVPVLAGRKNAPRPMPLNFEFLEVFHGRYFS
jgi:hypothetical protein